MSVPTVLHFDLNQTIIPFDDKTKLPVHSVIAHNLAKEVFGKWDGERDETYYNYIERTFHERRGNADAKKEKQALLSNFVTHLHEMHHPEADAISERHKKLCAAVEKIEGAIVPAFYELIKNLHEGDKIVLRTFGSELDQVAKEIEERTPIKFTVRGAFKDGQLHLDGGGILTSARDLAALFSSAHCAIQDNWQYWNDSKQDPSYGKIFPCNGHAVFHDDLEHRLVAPVDVETGKPADREKLREDGLLVRVNILEAIEDEDYFLNIYNKARGLVSV